MGISLIHPHPCGEWVCVYFLKKSMPAPQTTENNSSPEPTLKVNRKMHRPQCFIFLIRRNPSSSVQVDQERERTSMARVEGKPSIVTLNNGNDSKYNKQNKHQQKNKQHQPQPREGQEKIK
jgi:hypothetical protein